MSWCAAFVPVGAISASRCSQASAYVQALVLPIDLWLGADYGFVGNPPAGVIIPPFVAALGPWPQRAIILVALVPIGFVVVLLPWVVARAYAQRNRTVATRLPTG